MGKESKKYDASAQTEMEEQWRIQEGDNAFNHDFLFLNLRGNLKQTHGKFETERREESDVTAGHQWQIGIHDQLETHFKTIGVLEAERGYSNVS